MIWVRIVLKSIRIVINAVLLICLALLSCLLLSLVAYKYNRVIDVFPFINYQQSFYHQSRQVLQSNTNCVEYDPTLVYRLKDGVCKFSNMEFRTKVIVKNHERVVIPSGTSNSSRKRIFILGDSFAFGWGVENSQAFPSVIQNQTGVKVRNLSVPSYGTVRELQTLRKVDNFDEENDIVIIQYCANDLGENQEFSRKQLSKEESLSFYQQLTSTRADRLSFQSLISKSFEIPYNQMLYRWLKFKQRGDIKPIGGRWFLEHQVLLEKVISADIIDKNSKILVLVFGGKGDYSLTNFSSPTSNLPNLHFLPLELETKHYFKLDDHWTMLGHTEVASQVSKKLVQLGWLNIARGAE